VPLTGEGGLCLFGGEATVAGRGVATILEETAPILAFLENATRGGWSITYTFERGPPRRDIVTFTYNGAANPTVTGLATTGGWAVEAQNCRRMFARGTECTVTTVAEARARRGIIALFEIGVLVASGVLQL